MEKCMHMAHTEKYLPFAGSLPKFTATSGLGQNQEPEHIRPVLKEVNIRATICCHSGFMLAEC